jgi:adenine-specific DNA-methyltransferase
VLCDELFGRECFIADITWRKRDGPPNDRKIGSVHEHMLVWGRHRSGASKKTDAEEAFNLMPRTAKADSQYQVYEEPDGYDPRGAFRKIDSTANAKGGRYVESLVYPLLNPYTGEYVLPRKGRCWVYNKEEMARLQQEKRLFWGKKGTAGTPMRKLFKSEAKSGMTAPTIWDDVGLNQHASSEMEKLFGEKAAFETPKPEGLLKRIIEIATNPDDIVLDCFAGSGTTGAVALKMNRRFIMVEAGSHCETHIVPRLRKVIEGTDQGGISPLVAPHPSRVNTDTNLIGETKQQPGWTGGGGFRYYTLGKSLIERDAETGVWRLSYTNGRLVEAVCLQEGFKLLARGNLHGVRGRHYAHVADCIVTQDYVDAVASELAEDESLTLYCVKRTRRLTPPDNVQLKRIPRDLVLTANGAGGQKRRRQTA